MQNVVSLLVWNANACSISSLQDGRNVLHRAAVGGNVSMFDWLVKRFSLQPDQWSKVSRCMCLRYVTEAMYALIAYYTTVHG